MPRRAQRFHAALGLLALGLLGCAAADGPTPAPRPPAAGAPAGPASHLIADVPFIPQADYQCGPAALAMVLRFHGAPADAEAIARQLHLPSARGTLNLELEFFARRQGFRTEAFAGTLDRIRAEVRRGRPLIVFQDLGAAWLGGRLGAWPHFAVLIGFDDRAGEVILHSGTTPGLRVAYAEFERTWAARRHWTLLVTPPGAAG